MSTRPGKILQGKHVLMAAVGFFGVVLLVNGVFLYAALSTYTGVVAKEPYRRGLNYNERIAADERQAALGWHDEVELAREPASLTLTIADRSGAPVSGLIITGLLGRPATDRADRTLVLIETAPGRYSTDVGQLEAGGWLVTLEAVWPGTGTRAPVHRVRKRLWLGS